MYDETDCQCHACRMMSCLRERSSARRFRRNALFVAVVVLAGGASCLLELGYYSAVGAMGEWLGRMMR